MISVLLTHDCLTIDLKVTGELSIINSIIKQTFILKQIFFAHFGS